MSKPSRGTPRRETIGKYFGTDLVRTRRSVPAAAIEGDFNPLAVGVFTVTADWTAEPQNLNRVTTNAGSPGRWVWLGLQGPSRWFPGASAVNASNGQRSIVLCAAAELFLLFTFLSGTRLIVVVRPDAFRFCAARILDLFVVAPPLAGAKVRWCRHRRRWSRYRRRPMRVGRRRGD